MSRLQLARQGHQWLARAMDASLDEETSRQAEDWLTKEVCPVVEEMAQNRSFQLAARWSLEHLTRGANTKERQLVDAVEGGLVQLATKLAEVTVTDAGGTSAGIPDTGFRVRIDDSRGAKIEFVKGRPWLGLVCSEDFFHPCCELC